MNMKTGIFYLLVAFSILLVGCSEYNTVNNINNSNTTVNNPDDEEILCTMDAKICPDGTAVGRNPQNNCEFYECSGDQNFDPKYRRYAANDRTTCAATTFLCMEGTQPFFDDTGCGCEAIEPKKYTSNDLDECSRIRYMCVKNYVPFTDSEGCGCEWDWDAATRPDEKLQATDCTADQRNAEACTMEYNPVCGWFNQNIQCIAYPCAATYGNPCQACSDENVGSYTMGECPQVS